MPRKILLADDSITIQKVISLTLAPEGFEISIADEGTEALRMAREEAPDLVMADVGLPGKNGYEITDAIKKDPALKSTPVILLAGTFEPLDPEEADRVRADDHLVKPFESKVLVDKVKSLLEMYGRLEREAPPASQKAREQVWEEGNFLGFEEEFEEKARKEAPKTEEIADFGFVEFKAPEPEKAPAPAVAEEKKPEEEVWTAFDYGEPGKPFETGTFWKELEAPVTEEAWKPEEVGKFLEEEKEDERELKKPIEEIAAKIQDIYAEAGARIEAPKVEEGIAAEEAIGIEEAPAEAEEKVEEKVEEVEKAAPMAEIKREEVREIVERVAREIVREIAKDLVPGLAEKLVAEEVNRIRQAIKGVK